MAFRNSGIYPNTLLILSSISYDLSPEEYVSFYQLSPTGRAETDIENILMELLNFSDNYRPWGSISKTAERGGG